MSGRHEQVNDALGLGRVVQPRQHAKRFHVSWRRFANNFSFSSDARAATQMPVAVRPKELTARPEQSAVTSRFMAASRRGGHISFIQIGAVETAQPVRRARRAYMDGMPTDPHGPLHDIRVLDASRVLVGAILRQLLGELGPTSSSSNGPAAPMRRALGPALRRRLLVLITCPANHQTGVTLTWRSRTAKRFSRLARACVIFFENFRSDSTAKLGLTPNELLASIPGSSSARFPASAAPGLADRPAYDFAVQATKRADEASPARPRAAMQVGVAAADVLTGLMRRRGSRLLKGPASSGHGYAVDLALLDCAFGAQVNVAQAYLTSGQGAAAPGQCAFADRAVPLFATATAGWVLAIGNDRNGALLRCRQRASARQG